MADSDRRRSTESQRRRHTFLPDGDSKGLPRLDGARAQENGIPFDAPTAMDIEEMRDVFNLFDKDGCGAIDPKEVRLQMTALGFEADNTTIYQLMSDLDRDGSQMLEFEELACLMNEELKMHTPEYATRGNLSQMFEFLDALDPRKRKGQITLADLRRIANVLGDQISDAELQVMIKGADAENKGHVSCEDFYQLMIRTAAAGDDSGSEDAADSSLTEDDDFSEISVPSPPPAPREMKHRNSFLAARSKVFSVASLASLARKSVMVPPSSSGDRAPPGPGWRPSLGAAGPSMSSGGDGDPVRGGTFPRPSAIKKGGPGGGTSCDLSDL